MLYSEENLAILLIGERLEMYLGKILVSSCLLGEPVRYDGKVIDLISQRLLDWQEQGRVITICPEVAGGLSIPRPPAERKRDNVITTDGEDVTQAFALGAERALNQCLAHGIQVAILKERSPSCGSLAIYDGSFSGTTIKGEGVTSQILRANGIKVFSEEQMPELLAFVG